MSVPPIAQYISRAMAKLPETKPVKKLGNWFNKDFESALATSTIASICLKDTVGCVMYVYQSLHNDRIPEKRRKFVSAIDLTNGILMVGSQIGMFFLTRKISDKMFNAIFKKSFNPNMFKHLKELIRARQKEAGKIPDSTYKIRRDYEDIKNNKALSVFKVVIDLFGATIIGKRVLVPFIATPMAKVVEKTWDKHNEKHGTADKSNPSMQGNADTLEISNKPSDAKQGSDSSNLIVRYLQNNKNS